MTKSTKIEDDGLESHVLNKRNFIAHRVASLVNRDPRAEAIVNYEKECMRNSDDAIERLGLLLENWPLIRSTSQSKRSTLLELEESLSLLPQNCLLRKLPGAVLLRIIRLLPMTTMLSLASTCKTFNSIINEQRHDLKNVHRITLDFHEFRENRVILLNVRRRAKDDLWLVERYFHCSRVPIDTDFDNMLFKLRCSPEGVMWATNVLAALLVNARVSIIDFIGEHGVLFEQAQSFLKLCRGRRPFHVDKVTFGLTTKNSLGIVHCKFWTKLLQPKSLAFYSLIDGIFLRPKDYQWLLVQEVSRVIIHDAVNLTTSVLHQIIKEWFRGRRKFLPALEVTFHKTSEVELKIEDLVKKTVYKADVNSPDGFCAFIERSGGGEMKEIMKPCGEKKIIIKDHRYTTKNVTAESSSLANP